jgi:predicted secreted protein
MFRMIKNGLLGFLVAGNVFAGTMPVVPVAPNQKAFVIHLPGNATTGYMWSVKRYDTKLLKLVKKEYRPSPQHSKKRMVGVGGVMDFYFVCLPGVTRPKETTIKLLYARPWVKGTGDLTNVRVVFTNK